MKKRIPVMMMTLIILLVSGLQAEAKIWRVNNKSNYNGSTLWGDNLGGTAAFPVFEQIDQAIIPAANDDTIHVEGSTVTYDIATITKRLVIIGTGYYLTDNPATNNNTLQSNIKRIIVNAANTQIIGLNVVNAGSSLDAIVYVNVNGVTVKRCRIEGYVRFETLLSDVYILQNFFPGTIVSNALSTNNSSLFVPPTDIVFNNNICQKTLTWGTPLANPTTLWPIFQCNNNVFDGPDNLATPTLAFSASEFRNNILMPTNAVVNIAASSGVITYNIGTLSTQFGTSNNNLVIPAITSIFITSASNDGKYQVLAGSQANNSGSDGTDRGAFGSSAVTSRYTLSGLAAIPVIYEITTTGVATPTGLPVTIKARTIK
jgi:hypothetical protein